MKKCISLLMCLAFILSILTFNVSAESTEVKLENQLSNSVLEENWVRPCETDDKLSYNASYGWGQAQAASNINKLHSIFYNKQISGSFTASGTYSKSSDVSYLRRLAIYFNSSLQGVGTTSTAGDTNAYGYRIVIQPSSSNTTSGDATAYLEKNTVGGTYSAVNDTNGNPVSVSLGNVKSRWSENWALNFVVNGDGTATITCVFEQTYNGHSDGVRTNGVTLTYTDNSPLTEGYFGFGNAFEGQSGYAAKTCWITNVNLTYSEDTEPETGVQDASVSAALTDTSATDVTYDGWIFSKFDSTLASEASFNGSYGYGVGNNKSDLGFYAFYNKRAFDKTYTVSGTYSKTVNVGWNRRLGIYFNMSDTKLDANGYRIVLNPGDGTATLQKKSGADNAWTDISAAVPLGAVSNTWQEQWKLEVTEAAGGSVKVKCTFHQITNGSSTDNLRADDAVLEYTDMNVPYTAGYFGYGNAIDSYSPHGSWMKDIVINYSYNASASNTIYIEEGATVGNDGKFEITVKNDADGPLSAWVIVGIYAEDNELIGVFGNDVTSLEAGATQKLDGTVELSPNKTPECARIFVWDGKTTLNPYCDSVDVELQ